MAYTIVVTLIDFAGFFTAGTPTMAGSIFSPPPASGSAAAPLAKATSVPPATTIAFTSSAVPPAGPSSVLVTATAPPSNPVLGDLFRSGGLGSLPPSPAPLIVFTVPVQIVSAATLSGMVASSVGAPFTTTIPTGVAAAVAALSGGILIPLTLTIASVTLTLAPGTITIAVAGTLVVRQFLFVKVSHVFAFTATLALTPSSDSSNAPRIFAVTPAASTFGATGIPGFVTGPVAPFLASSVASTVESGLNGAIPPVVASSLASSGMELTPTAVISALNPTILGGGVAVRLVIADLFGPAITPIPGTLAVSIKPQIVLKERQTYTVTVTDAAKGTPVSGAAVVLRNYTGEGAIPVITQEATDAQGQASFTVELQNGTMVRGGGKGPPVIVTLAPTLSVSAQGFNPVLIALG
jgi:hypothetical protein